jgi:DNA-binding PucR family transcriptional regulator
MTLPLWAGGAGLGTARGQQLAVSMLADADLSRVNIAEVDGDPFIGRCSTGPAWHDHYSNEAIVVYCEPQSWPVVSARAQELIRQGALTLLQQGASFVENVQAIALSGDSMRAIAVDPVLAERSRRTTMANVLHWATANVEHPGARVTPDLGPEALSTARDMVRRGLDKEASESYRKVQAVAWRRWVSICFDLTDDATELREVLDVSALSISAFVDDTIAARAARMDEERDDLTRGASAERRATLALIIEGAPIDRSRAEQRLGYNLSGPHTAVVVWGRPGTDVRDLEDVAESVMQVSGAERRLTIVADASTLWLWIPRTAADNTMLAPIVNRHPDVRMAIGRTGAEIPGFRTSYLDAVTTQRMLDAARTTRRLATYHDVQLIALLSQNLSTDEYLQNTLGPLVDADAEREILLAYIRERCNATATAERLFTHRNTVLRRLLRAEELLPRPLDEHLVEVAVALEILAWRDDKRTKYVV